MFDAPFSGGGNIPNDTWTKAKRLPDMFQTEVRTQALSRGLPPGVVPCLRPCNVWAMLDRSTLHIAFTHVDAGGVPRKTWEDSRPQGPYTADQVCIIAEQFKGLVKPFVVSFPSSLFDAPDEACRTAAADGAKQYLDQLVMELTRPRAPIGYEHLQPLLDRFIADHPDPQRNVFVMMRFRSEPHFVEIFEAIRDTLALYGLRALRADQKTYPTDDDLWDNVCTYMLGSSLGISVFEDIDERYFNPNVSLEYGFMRALGRRILLLKERRLPTMPSDLIGKLYRPFDQLNIRPSIRAQLAPWLENDLGKKKADI